MEPLLIGSIKLADFITKKTDCAKKSLSASGIDLMVERSEVDQYSFLKYQTHNRSEMYSKEDVGKILRHCIADALAEAILEEHEVELIGRIIKDRYGHFTDEEQESLVKGALKYLEGPDSISRNCFYRLARKARIVKAIIRYLGSSSIILVEGFVRFRLKSLVESIKVAVDHAVDDLLREKEQREFIHLLKYFVDTQKPRTESVHVVLGKHSFRILDQNGDKLKLDNDLPGQGTDDDMLISALISVAPRRIILHCSKQAKVERKEVITTLVSVFEGRVTQCQGCRLCDKYLNQGITEKQRT